MSTTGLLDVELVTPTETYTHPLEVQLAGEPTLDVVNSQPAYLLQVVGMTAHVAGAPNDAAVLFASVDPNPTSLPGIIEAGVGGGNLDAVFILGVQLVDPSTGITTFQVPMQSLDTGFTFHTQAGLLRAANPVFPLVPTNVQTATILF
jgi:tRNA A58 N-methylase Trm61